MGAGRLHELADLIRNRKVLVLGDLILDEYIWGKVSRISPEAPVPVVNIERETRTLGGAGNVALNAKLLGLDVVLSGFIGEDFHGGSIRKLLKKNGIACDGVCSWKGMNTTVKTRIVAHSQQVVRIDREERVDIPSAKVNELEKKAKSIVREIDFIMVSDYNKGAVSGGIFHPLIEEARKKGKPVIVDPKKRDVSFYKGCSVIKPNMAEAELFSGVDIESEDDIILAGKRIIRKTLAGAVLITRGEKGMTLVEKGRRSPLNIPAIAQEVFDVTGAGDTVLSTFSAALSAGGSLEESALLSNIAAAVVVGEVGTSPITRDKLKKAIERYGSG